MNRDDESDPIEQMAAEWLAESGEGMSRQRAREFKAWKALDPRHAAAVARLEQACALLEELPQVRSRILPVLAFPVSVRATSSTPGARRRAWIRVVGLAAAVSLLAALGWRFKVSAPESREYATSDGGYNRVVLADGSVVELNANTVVRVSFPPGERRVALEAGEAYFTVAPDQARPFVVSAGHVSVRAVGTAFNVRHGAQAVEVLVTEGRVQLAATSKEEGAPGSPSGMPVRATLAANERLTVPPPAVLVGGGPGAMPPVVERVPDEVLRSSLAWQERRLVFAQTPLREVVAQFNRRNRVQLVLGDPSLAERPVGGTFAADNAEGFARLLEASGTIAAQRRGEWEIVLSPVR